MAFGKIGNTIIDAVGLSSAEPLPRKLKAADDSVHAVLQQSSSLLLAHCCKALRAVRPPRRREPAATSLSSTVGVPTLTTKDGKPGNGQ
eukprot:8945368-Pyramimonas_sp.AAC.1